MVTARVWSLLGVFVPKTLFARSFLSILLLSVLIVFLTGSWFYHRSFQMMDSVAGARLLAGTRLLAHDLTRLRDEDDLGACDRLLEQRFGRGHALGWIQNVYWVDMRKDQPRFLASFTLGSDPHSTLLPPSLDDVDDLTDDGIDSLDAGQPVFPDPFAQAAGRRFKIVLFPVLDREGFLDSVVGLEADMEYLDLSISARQTVLWAALLAVPLCILGSFLWARSFTRRIRVLLDDLGCLARQESIPEQELGIRELDLLRQGLVDLGKRLEQRTRHIQDVHSEKLLELSLLGGAIAHEIRNPLSAIELHLGLLKRQMGTALEFNPSIAEIQEQLSAMKMLVERFLNYSRKVTPQADKVSLRELCEAVVKNAGNRDHAIEAHLEIPEDLSIQVDGALFRQVLENLLDNSLAARPLGLVIVFLAEKTNGLVRLTVSDNGPGVPSDLVSRLFTPFVTGRRDGYGIGLALSRKLVEAHDGFLRYQPAPSGGACFIIEIPEHP